MDEGFGTVDPDGLAAAVALQRAGIEEYETELAIRKMQLDDIERTIQEEKDARMARSIACANVADAEAIEAARQEDEEEVDIGDEDDMELMIHQARPATNDLKTLSKLAGEYISPAAGKVLLAEEETGIPGVWRFGHQVSEASVAKTDCVVCGDAKEYFEIMDVSCGHAYCRECVRELFLASFKDESLFPPRCCRQPLTLENVDIFLTRAIRDAFPEKELEFGTKDRMYCHNMPCSAFIAPADCNPIKGYARCQKCPKLTCLKCKQKHHGGGYCPPDPERQVVLDLAEQAGWQACPQCNTMVELNTGCYHITCKCGYEFCYVCAAAPWKTCDCPEWEEEFLLERANEIVLRENPHAGANPHDLVRQAADMLAANHNCDHQRFRWVPGEFECDECHLEYNRFIYRCRQCRVQFCWRCRHNRTR